MSTRFRQLTNACLTVLFSIVASVALAEIVLRSYTDHVQSREQMDPGFLVYDADLGWRMAPNWSGQHLHYDFDARYSTNADGLRGAAWPEPFAGRGQRIAFIGDSFTFGLGVNDDETFVERLAATDTDATFINAGIAGYSTDQQLLFLRDHLASWRIDRLILVVYLANDLLDNELRFPLQAEMGKPRFMASPAGLALSNVPVPREPKSPEEHARTLATAVLGREIPRSWRNEWQLTRTLGLAEVADAEILTGMPERLAPPVDLFVQLAAQIQSLCVANEVALTLVLMPGRSYVEAPESLSAAFQEELRRQILARQADIGVPVIDLASQIRQRYDTSGERLFFPNEGHLNPAGHNAVAELLRGPDGLRL